MIRFRRQSLKNQNTTVKYRHATTNLPSPPPPPDIQTRICGEIGRGAEKENSEDLLYQPETRMKVRKTEAEKLEEQRRSVRAMQKGPRIDFKARSRNLPHQLFVVCCYSCCQTTT